MHLKKLTHAGSSNHGGNTNGLSTETILNIWLSTENCSYGTSHKGKQVGFFKKKPMKRSAAVCNKRFPFALDFSVVDSLVRH